VDIDARLEAEPSWSTSGVELHPPPRHEASGEGITCYTTKKDCAVLVRDSSAPGQTLRVRTVPSDEPAPRRDESGSDEEERFAAENTAGLCDACYDSKGPLLRAARIARQPRREVVSKYAPTSHLTPGDRATQASGKVEAKDAKIAQLEARVEQLKAGIEKNGETLPAPLSSKSDVALSAMMRELRSQFESGAIKSTTTNADDYAMLRAQEELAYEYHRRNNTLNGMRWSYSTLIKAWQLMAGNKSKYEWLHESGLVSLPSSTLLQKNFGSNDITGHDTDRYHRLSARTAHLKGQCRFGSLNRDEMKIKVRSVDAVRVLGQGRRRGRPVPADLHRGRLRC
jgi:hypothetical protein